MRLYGGEIYVVDGLFEFEEYRGECFLQEYLRKNDPTITEIEIPAECHGFPVTTLNGPFFKAKFIKRVVVPPSVRIVDRSSFSVCTALESVELSEGLETISLFAFQQTGLKTITLPKSLKRLCDMAFAECYNLENVVFNSEISLGEKVFVDCYKLPANVTLMGLVNSSDISNPFDENAYMSAFGIMPTIHGKCKNEYIKYTRPDVFELAIKNDCFRSVDVFVMLKFLFEKGHTERLLFVAEHGLLEKRELVDEYIERSAREGLTELTAYLLELKRRKFGFKKGGDFDL